MRKKIAWLRCSRRKVSTRHAGVRITPQAILLFALLASLANAQSSSPSQSTTRSSSENQPRYTLHETVQEVLLYCTVLDHKGNLVTDLDRSAFKVAEDKVPAVIVARPDDDHHGAGDGVGPGAQTVSSNGFGLIARVVALTSLNTQVLQGFAYYSLAKSLYYNFIAKGHQTTFPHDTEIQVTLSER